MKLKNIFITSILLIMASPLCYASYSQFTITIPIWLKILAYGLISLIATPFFWSIWLIGKYMCGFILSTKDGERLLLFGTVHVCFASVYMLFFLGSINLYQAVRLTLEELLFVAGPIIILLGLAIFCVRVGKSTVNGHDW